MRNLFVVIITILCYQSTSMAQSSDNLEGNIIFASDRDRAGDFEIYMVDAKGDSERRITRNNSNDTAPAWSPDGTQIAFESDRNGNADIYVMNADGSSELRLTNNDAVDWAPSWSPDGTQIAFESGRNGNADIYVMNVDGSGQTALTRNGANDRSPVWSPDGTQIAFHSDRGGNSAIYVMNADGSNEQRITDLSFEASFPAWSPTGDTIAFQSDQNNNWDIFTVDVDGGNVRQLSDSPIDEGFPRWSSDANHVVYHSNSEQNWDIFIVRADGASSPLQVTTHDKNDQQASWFITPRAGRIVHVERNVTITNISTRSVDIPNCENPAPADQTIGYQETHSRQLIVRRNETEVVESGSSVTDNGVELEAQLRLDLKGIKIPFAQITAGVDYEELSVESKVAYNAVEQEYSSVIGQELSKTETLKVTAEPFTSMTYNIQWDIIGTVGTIEIKQGNLVVGYVDFIISQEVQGQFTSIVRNECP